MAKTGIEGSCRLWFLLLSVLDLQMKSNIANEMFRVLKTIKQTNETYRIDQINEIDALEIKSYARSARASPNTAKPINVAPNDHNAPNDFNDPNAQKLTDLQMDVSHHIMRTTPIRDL